MGILLYLYIRLVIWALWVGVLITLFFYVGIPVACLVAAGFVLIAVADYVRGAAAALGVGPEAYLSVSVPAPPPTHQNGRDPAWPHYLYGPALLDLRQIGKTAWPRPWRRFRELTFQVNSSFQASYFPVLSWRRPIGLALWLGLACGLVVGYGAIVFIAFYQFVVLFLMFAAGIAFTQLLRLADTAVRQVRRIAIACPRCRNRPAYPIYECPSCEQKHRDVRPGRYGMIRRKCACDAELPTLLMLGTSRMKAYCPICDCSMAKSVGAEPEIVLPLLGGPDSGKTRLMLAMVMNLTEQGGRHGASAVFDDDDSLITYNGFVPNLRNGLPTWKTVLRTDDLQSAYSLKLKPAGGGRRLLNIYDAAGEIAKSADLLGRQRYLPAARTFLFVLDPLSIPAFWDGLDPGEQDRLREYRSSMSAHLAFTQVLDSLHGHRVNTRKARLIVAVAKADLISDHLPDDRDQAIAEWLSGPGIGLEHLVRLMRKSFRTTVFFQTSAWMDGGVLDPSIDRLTTWFLKNEGLKTTR